VKYLGTKLVSLHQNGLTSLYTIYKNTQSDTQGASRAPPPAPPSGGGAPPTIDPSGPGGNRPVIAAPAIAAHRTHGLPHQRNSHTMLQDSLILDV
jgi:hypothetical protein